MASRRQERINVRIVQEVSQALRTLKNPNVTAFVTITRAEVSPDLHHAKVFVSILAEQDETEANLEALRHSAGHIRREISSAFATKYVPHLDFQLDKNIAYADEMSRLIREARASDPNLAVEGDLSPAPSDAALSRNDPEDEDDFLDAADDDGEYDEEEDDED